MNHYKHTVTHIPEIDMRIDRFIAEELDLISRSQIKQRIEKVLINGKKTKLSKKIHLHDCIEIYFTDPCPHDLVPEKIEFSILFENEHVIVINKPQGIVVHPGCGNPSHTMVNGLIYYCDRIKTNFKNTEIRPGIVHRLDKDTSGVIIVAKDSKTHGFLSGQFEKSRVEKSYLAIVKGEPPEQFGTIDTHIKRDIHHRKKFQVSNTGGKRAITCYTLLESQNNFSLLLVRPKTGRTHQIRVHLKHLRCPIVGDPLYSRKDKHFPEASLMLHAYTLTIRLPGKKKADTFKAPLPEHFNTLMGEIGFSFSGMKE